VIHHVTQRGVNRQNVFFSQQDREVYLELCQANQSDAGVRLLAYCLMTNHLHWVVVPDRPESLAVFFQRVHGRYAQYLNARRRRTGHLWQNRFFSCAVAGERAAVVLRYVESNPVRANLAQAPEDYAWSSAAAHLAGPGSEAIPLLDWDDWTSRGGAAGWRRLVSGEESVRDVTAVRRATFSGAPFGPDAFVREWEHEFGRKWRQPGRPRRMPVASETGTELFATMSVG
jgi:putative transposase